MINISKKVLPIFFINSLSWVAGYNIVILIMNHSMVKEMIGIIVGWWLALYLGYIFSAFSKLALLALAPLIFLFLLLLNKLGHSLFFFHDLFSDNWFQVFYVALIHTSLIISPIILNLFVFNFINYVKKTN